MWRTVTLTEGGGLAIRGHDLGPRVAGAFGCTEYEFERLLSAQEVEALCEALAVPPGVDVLAAIADRFPSATGLEEFIQEHGIRGQFWNRIGD